MPPVWSTHHHPSGLHRSPHGANRRLAGPQRVLEIAGMMKTKLLGRTGVSVSQLCFGTMSFGGDADEATSAAMFKAVRDAGINFFDTANEYSKGKSEEILGRLMKAERDDLVITTKVFNPIRPDVNARGGSRRHIAQAVESSLNRLQTDRIDVLFMHRYDAATPIEETMRAL